VIGAFKTGGVSQDEWWDESLPHITEDKATKAEALLREDLFSGRWSRHAVRLMEEEAFFACNHRFRLLGYSLYPAMYAEHLDRWRFVFKKMASFMLVSQEAVLERPEDTLEGVFKHMPYLQFRYQERRSRLTYHLVAQTHRWRAVYDAPNPRFIPGTCWRRTHQVSRTSTP